MLLIFVEDSLALADPTLQMTTALTGLHGAKEAARIIPDLVLVDYVLPDIKGDEVCRRIGRSDSTARVPIIMMSGHVHEMTAVASKLPNVAATITKPFISDALVALVQRTLKEGRLREKPTFPSEKEIARARSAEFAISKTPILSQPEQKPTRRPMEGGAAATPKIPAGSQNLASPPPLPILKTAPQKLEPVGPRLAPNEVLLDLPLDVVAMHVNAAFQIGAIRARPASLTVAIEIPALTAKTALPLKTGFHLGPIDLDATGCISIVRLIPTSQPYRSVEVAPNFEIRQLVLRCRGKAVRVSLSSQSSQAQSGASFEATSVQLDQSRRIDELTLIPI